MSENLKPCPFCGGPGYLRPIRDGMRVVCKGGKCFAGGPQEFHGPADMPSATARAAAAWNNRSDADDTAGGSAPRPSGDAALFHNALRILTSIDMDEFIQATTGHDIAPSRWDDRDAAMEAEVSWKFFRADPFRWFIKAPDVQRDAIWALVKARQR